MLSGLFLLLAALVSFGVGGYVAGRLRERWVPSAHSHVVEFRDGTHGIVAWALAVVITGVVAAVSVASLTSKTAPAATSSATTAGEPLIAYELDRLFRGDRPRLRAILPMLGPRPGASFCQRQDGGGSHRRTGRI
jgi:hypothetical protein